MNSQWSDYLGSNPLGYSNIDGGNGNDPYSLRSLQGQSARGTNQPGGTPAYNLSYTQLNPNGSATGVPPNDCMSWDPSTDQGQLTEETGGDVAPQYSPMSGNPEILVDTRHLNPQNPRLPPQFKPFAGSIYNVNAASLNPPGLGPPILFGPLDEQEARNILFPGEISSNAPSEAFSSHPNDTASVMSGLSGRDANTPPLFAQTIGRRHSHSDVGRLPSNIQSQGGEAPSDSIFLGQTVATLTLANKRFRSQLSKCWKEKNRWERGHKSVCDRKKHLEEESIKLEETKRAQATRIAYLEDLLSRIVSQGGQVDQRTRDEMEGYLKQTKSSIPSQTVGSTHRGEQGSSQRDGPYRNGSFFRELRKKLSESIVAGQFLSKLIVVPTSKPKFQDQPQSWHCRLRKKNETGSKHPRVASRMRLRTD
nr:hypothetical protein L203_01999 [Cryptococcus depauperatus CBS 7841]